MRSDLLEVVDGDGVGVVESHRLLDQSPAEPRLQLVQLPVDVALRQRHVTNMAVVPGCRRVVGVSDSGRQRHDGRQPHGERSTPTHRQSELMYRPIDRYRRSQHRKSHS